MIAEAIESYKKQHGLGTFAPKAVLFDMDGVLFDSMPIHARTWERVSHQVGLPMTQMEAYLNEGRTAMGTIDVLTRRTWGRPATEDDVRRIYAMKCAAFNAEPEAPHMPGALEALSCARSLGLGIYVVTGSGQQSLLARLTTAYPGFFAPERVVSGKDTTHGKPHPEPYLRGLERAGLPAREALVVENAPLGVRAAVAAHIFTVAVNTGPIPDEALEREGANLVLPSMTRLAELLPEIVRCSIDA